MLELPFNDILECVESEKPGFTASGLEIPGSGNLVLDAEAVFRTYRSVPYLSFHLHKLIPMGGGLGGGSSDAAFALKMLRDKYAPDMPNEILKTMAAKIGSDCAFFIEGGIQFATGRGEVLAPLELNLKNRYIVLVNLGIHVSTREAYAGVVPDPERIPLREILQQPIETWKDELENDFEKSVFQRYPALAEIKNDLYRHGAIYSAMTGSGSTMYGIFESEVSAVSWSHPVSYERYLKL